MVTGWVHIALIQGQDALLPGVLSVIFMALGGISCLDRSWAESASLPKVVFSLWAAAISLPRVFQHHSANSVSTINIKAWSHFPDKLNCQNLIYPGNCVRWDKRRAETHVRNAKGWGEAAARDKSLLHSCSHLILVQEIRWRFSSADEEEKQPRCVGPALCSCFSFIFSVEWWCVKALPGSWSWKTDPAEK